MRPKILSNLPPVQTGSAWAVTLDISDEATGRPPKGFAGWDLRAGIFADATTAQPLAVCTMTMDADTRVLTLSLTAAITADLPPATAMLLVFAKVTAGAEPDLIAYGAQTIAELAANWEGLA